MVNQMGEIHKHHMFTCVNRHTYERQVHRGSLRVTMPLNHEPRDVGLDEAEKDEPLKVFKMPWAEKWKIYSGYVHTHLSQSAINHTQLMAAIKMQV